MWRSYLNHGLRKPVLTHMRTTKTQMSLRIRAVWSALRLSLPRLYNTYSCYYQNFKTLASFCSLAGRFESYLVANVEWRFSRDVAHFAFDVIREPPSIITLVSYVTLAVTRTFPINNNFVFTDFFETLGALITQLSHKHNLGYRHARKIKPPLSPISEKPPFRILPSLHLDGLLSLLWTILWLYS